VGQAAEVVAGFLRVEEAEMLTELLASEGIDAWFEGAVASCLGPLIPGAGGGAKLLVPAPHAERARELIAHSGVLGGEVPCTPSESACTASTGRVTYPLYPVLITLVVVAATVASLALRG
jgi:hypothetical protein